MRLGRGADMLNTCRSEGNLLCTHMKY